ncbi:hypothetical protein [Streptomyces sp. NPDC023838]|uniref:hypothetical protein n=1 Tax=Streptomyces sp. NPDC023838 TaxID=3154325 RepID=UPI0033EE3F67
MGEKPDIGTKQDERRLDLSVPQVAGSALAAIAAAVLASRLGVYGTVIGAGVVSVVATCGGTVFQHLFRRTGEQLRDVTVQSLPRARRDAGLPVYEDAREGEFGAATVHGTRLRGWKRSALGAAVVFAVAMGGITAYELASGGELGGGGGTTFGSVVSGSGGTSSQKDSEPERRAPHTPGTGADGGTDGGTPSSPDPGKPSPGKSDPGKGAGGTSATGGTTGSGGTTPSPTPRPSTGGGPGASGGTPGPPPSPSPSKDGVATGSGGATPDPDAGTGSGAAPPAP